MNKTETEVAPFECLLYSYSGVEGGAWGQSKKGRFVSKGLPQSPG